MTETKRKRRDVKFNISLNEDQKEAKRLIYNNHIVALTGQPGTGKTATAINTALDMLFNKDVSKIYITRPTVEAGNTSLGFLPGSLQEKYGPYLKPIEQAIESNYSGSSGGMNKTAKLESMFTSGDIEILSIQHARGINIDNAILIVDEAQNVSIDEARMLLTRIKDTGKVVFTGDLRQSDIKYTSGLQRLIEIAGGSDDIQHLQLKQNYRADVVTYIDKNL